MPKFQTSSPKPNFFIVGAMRAGTTALANLIATHPQVFFAPVKEPNYFSSDLTSTAFAARHRETTFNPLKVIRTGKKPRKHFAYIDDPDTYLALFAGSTGQPAIGEASTTYLYSTAAAAEIAAEVPQARIIAILRNPFERAISEYLMNRSIGTAVGPFSAALERERKILDRGETPFEERYVFAGLYCSQIKRYFNHFDRHQILILRNEDLREDPRSVLLRVCQHLKINDPIDDTTPIKNRQQPAIPRFEILNQLLYHTGLKQRISDQFPHYVKKSAKRIYYKSAGSVDMTSADWDYLYNTLKLDIEELSSVVGCDFSYWLRPQRP